MIVFACMVLTAGGLGCGDAPTAPTGGLGAGGASGGGGDDAFIGNGGTSGSTGGSAGSAGSAGSTGSAGPGGFGGTAGTGAIGGIAGSGGSGTGGHLGTGGSSGSGGIARPWAYNTGPRNPELLTPLTPGEITADGTIIENADMRGTIEIKADNVTLRNFRITGGLYGIRVEDGHTGIVFEDGEIHDVASAAIIGVGFTAKRLHIHDTGNDGIKPQGSTSGSTLIESCFLEKLGRDSDAHPDGIESTGSNAPLVVRNNNIHMPYPGTPNYPGAPYKSNSTIKLVKQQVSGNLVTGNWLSGGNYTVFCLQESGGVEVSSNLFGRDNAGWADGKEDRRIRSGSCSAWLNNRWEDNGDLIP